MSASTRLNILLDLSGTLHIGDAPTPSAIPALSKLRHFLSQRGNASLRFASNTTKEAPASLQRRLLRCGFREQDVPTEDLYTSLSATAKALAKTESPALLLLSSSAQQVFHDPPAHTAARHFRPRADRLPKDLSEEEWSRLKRCNVVVVGLAPDLMRSEWLDEAFRLLSGEYAAQESMDKRSHVVKPRIIATHKALYYRPVTAAPLSMGPGPYVSALETAASLDSRATMVCGKPSRGFFEEVLREMRGGGEAQAGERNIVVGDDVSADLSEGAIELGLERVLVKTGKYRQGDEAKAAQPVSAVHDNFSHWVEALITQSRVASS